MKYYRTIFLAALVLAAQVCITASAAETDFEQAKKKLMRIAAQQKANNELTDDQLRTLESLQQIEGYNMYTMTYYGDYGFEEYLEVGGWPFPENPPASVTCSTFSALTPDGEALHCYNQDNSVDSWALILFTDPPDGYASMSISRTDFCWIDSYIEHPEVDWIVDHFLCAPFVPFDGMNEYGLCISPMYVQGTTTIDPGKISLYLLCNARLVLDHARTVDEAIALLDRYNNLQGNEVHFLISDAYGDSAIVEWMTAGMVVSRRQDIWQVCTNFGINNRDPGSQALFSSCRRYSTAYRSLLDVAGIVDVDAAFGILDAIAQRDTTQDHARTVWSSVYNQFTGEWRICFNRNYNDVHQFNLKMVTDLAVSDLRPGKDTVRQGRKLKATATITNEGIRETKAGTVNWFLSRRKKMTKSALLVGSSAFGDLAPEQSTTTKARLKIPRDLNPKKYYLIGTLADDGANNDPELKNNSAIGESAVSVVGTKKK